MLASQITFIDVCLVHARNRVVFVMLCYAVLNLSFSISRVVLSCLTQSYSLPFFWRSCSTPPQSTTDGTKARIGLLTTNKEIQSSLDRV